MLGKNWFVRYSKLIKMKLENSSRKMAVGVERGSKRIHCCMVWPSDYRSEETVKIWVHLHQGRW